MNSSQPTDNNSAEAALALGQLMLDTGQPLAAIDSFTFAAQSGNAVAMTMLGRIHERGWGVPADPALAVAFYRRAIEAGDIWAMHNLADLYLSGTGVAQSDAEAHRLFSEAARAGHAKAQNMLGMMAEAGRGPDDVASARDYFLASAEGGDCWGQYNAARVLIDADQIEAGLDWIDRSLGDGFPLYLRTVAEMLKSHPDPRVRKRAVWAETLSNRQLDPAD